MTREPLVIGALLGFLAAGANELLSHASHPLLATALIGFVIAAGVCNLADNLTAKERIKTNVGDPNHNHKK